MNVPHNPRLWALTFAAFGLTGQAATAHGIWIAESHSNLAVIYGHGASDEAYDPAKLTSLRGCDAAGACADIISEPLPTHVEIARPAGMTLLSATFDNGYWSKDAAGEWQNLPKTEVPGATEGGQYLKYTTYVLDHLTLPVTPAGLTLEIVPMADPMTLSAGDILTVQVLFHGAPAVGAEVIADYVNDGDAAPVLTDADGMAQIVVRNQGQNVLAVSMSETPADLTLADEVGHTATLAFSLMHGEE